MGSECPRPHIRTQLRGFRWELFANPHSFKISTNGTGYKHFATDGNDERYVQTGNRDAERAKIGTSRFDRGWGERRGGSGLASPQKEKWG